MKLNKHRIIKVLAAIVLVIVVFASLGKFHNTLCNSIDIKILNSSDVNFVDKNEVLAAIHKAVPDIEGYKMDSVDIYLLETTLRANPYIRKVAIYKTISGSLKIDVQQRMPVLMVVNNTGQSYYIDTDGYIFGTCNNSHPPTIVANGFIKDKFDFSNGKIYKVDFANKKGAVGTGNTSADLFKLTQLIQADDFWRDQIEQIYVNEFGEYELVPMLGELILALGSIDDYDKKMFILKQFYFKGLPRTGWNVYKQISVKYKDQIVCKRLHKK